MLKTKKGAQPKKYFKGLSKSTKDKRDAHFAKGKKKADNDPSAYKPTPGDADAKTKPSKYTKHLKICMKKTHWHVLRENIKELMMQKK